MRPVINSEKHYVHWSVTTVGLGAIGQQNVVNAQVTPAGDNQVREGAEVRAVYIEIWITSDDANSGSFSFSVEKRDGAQPAMTYANSIALGTYSNKKNIFFESQGINNPRGGVATPVFRDWVKIPKGKQRFGLNDKIVINISGITNGLDYCGFSTYKERF